MPKDDTEEEDENNNSDKKVSVNDFIKELKNN